MSTNPVHKMADVKQMPQARTWREEKVFIYFSPRGTNRFAGHSVPGDWVVAEGRKPVSPGQEVTWQVVAGGDKLEVNLPDVFEAPLQKVIEGDTLSATVRGDATPGLYFYDVYVNDQLATGGSSPGVIIDQ